MGPKRNFGAGAELLDWCAGPELAKTAYTGRNHWTCSAGKSRIRFFLAPILAFLIIFSLLPCPISDKALCLNQRFYNPNHLLTIVPIALTMSKPYYPGEQPGLEVGVPPMPSMPPQQIHPDYMAYQSPYYQAASKEAPPYIPQQQPATPEYNRICGLPTRIFWIVFAVVLLVLGAALGAGLGAGLSAHKTAHLPDNSGSASSSGTPEQQQSTSHSAYAYPTAATTSPSTTTSSSSPTSTIQPFSTKPGTYRIVNVATYNALDLYLGGTTNGTEIECW
jgi:hypothetical protein